MDDVPDVLMRGPLAPHRETLWAVLLQRGYTLLSACTLMCVAAHLSRWLLDAHLSASDLGEVQIEEFLRRRTPHPSFTSRRSVPFLSTSRAIGGQPDPTHPEENSLVGSCFNPSTLSLYRLGRWISPQARPFGGWLRHS